MYIIYEQFITFSFLAFSFKTYPGREKLKVNLNNEQEKIIFLN